MTTIIIVAIVHISSLPAVRSVQHISGSATAADMTIQSLSTVALSAELVTEDDGGADFSHMY